ILVASLHTSRHRLPPTPTRFPYTTLFRSHQIAGREARHLRDEIVELAARLAWPHQAVAENILLADDGELVGLEAGLHAEHGQHGDRKSTRLNSSHVSISYAVFCLKQKMIL